jgi:hypothetical protein
MAYRQVSLQSNTIKKSVLIEIGLEIPVIPGSSRCQVCRQGANQLLLLLTLSDFLFTVKGDTKGAVLVQWNIHESTQGSAGMWDCHFRVGGATNSFLQLADCPPRTDGKTNPKCMAAALLLHLTPKSSGYFENVWAW